MNYSDYLEQLPFQRASFYGLGLPWYGIDELGQIAIFEGGDFPIPGRVFSDKSEYLELFNYFENLPRITTARLVEKFTRIRTFYGEIADYGDALAIAERGVYLIEEKSIVSNNESLEGYYLMAIPDEKLHIRDLPETIKQLLQPYFFPIDFSEIEMTEKIDVTKYLDCN